MFQNLSAAALLRYPALLLLVLVLQWPTYQQGYLATDESFYLVSAQRIVDGGTQYVDTWDNKPPVVVWFYAGVVYVFGDASLGAIRALASLILLGSALLFGSLLSRYNVGRDGSMLGMVVFLIANSSPWYAQELNTEQLLTFIGLLTVHLYVRHFIEERPRWTNLFWMGILCALSVLTKYQGIALPIALFFAYLFIASYRMHEAAIFGGGFVLFILAVVLTLYFNGSLDAYWDIGVVYNLDYIRVGANPGERASWFGLVEYLKHWGVWMVGGLLGFMAFRGRVFNTSIRLRRLEVVMSMWLLFTFLAVLVGGKRLYLHYFVQVLPPLLFYTVYFIESRKALWARRLWLVSGSAFAVALYGLFILSNNPARFETYLRPYASPGGYLQSLYYQLHGEPEVQALAEDIDRQGPINGIWQTGYHPEWYLRLGQPCAAKYTNPIILYNKLTWLSGNNQRFGLISRPETPGDVYRAFAAERPDYIIDNGGFFEELRYYIPVLLGDYQRYEVAGVPVFVLPAEKRQHVQVPASQ